MNEYYLLEQEYDVVYDYNPNIKGEFVDIIHNDSENNVIRIKRVAKNSSKKLKSKLLKKHNKHKKKNYEPIVKLKTNEDVINDAVSALRGIGFTKRDATNAITTASNNKKFDCPLELVKSALSRTSV
tara:strand:+ start:207 stop:587 length:381 start_codon:yes stop_codon:yes gene_type:complete